MPSDETIDPAHAEQAIAKGLELHPELAASEPRLVRVPVFRGTALKVAYGSEDLRPTGTVAWDFQNAIVKEYKRLAGE